MPDEKHLYSGAEDRWSDRRRRAVDEALALRGEYIARAPAGESPDPGGRSRRWPLAIAQLGLEGLGARTGVFRRVIALRVIAVALAWVEAIDED